MSNPMPGMPANHGQSVFWTYCMRCTKRNIYRGNTEEEAKQKALASGWVSIKKSIWHCQKCARNHEQE